MCNKDQRPVPVIFRWLRLVNGEGVIIGTIFGHEDAVGRGRDRQKKTIITEEDPSILILNYIISAVLGLADYRCIVWEQCDVSS